VLAGGHTFVGRLVLDRLPRDLHPTRFGDGALTRGAVVFTWHALSVMLTTTGAVLIARSRRARPRSRGGRLPGRRGLCRRDCTAGLAEPPEAIGFAPNAGVGAPDRHHRPVLAEYLGGTLRSFAFTSVRH